MATNICLDCAYFGGKCDKASEEIRECNEYEFKRREIQSGIDHISRYKIKEIVEDLERKN